MSIYDIYQWRNYRGLAGALIKSNFAIEYKKKQIFEFFVKQYLM